MSIYKNGKLIAGGRQCMPLLSFMWSDHQLNHPSWLNSTTFSWQSGAVYQAAYQHLVDDVNNANWIVVSDGRTYTRAPGYDTTKGTYDYYGWENTDDNIIVYTVDDVRPLVNKNVYASTSVVLPVAYGQVTQTPFGKETIGSTTVYYITASDGHKICTASEESNVQAIYNSTGVAWYYILDTENQRFKLPRTKFGFTGLRDDVGNYVEAGLPNITGTISGLATRHPNDAATTGAFYKYSGSSARTGDVYGSMGIGFDAQNSNSIYGNSDTVQPKATEMYLYFYVGNFTQTAIENTAGITTEEMNNKVNIGHEVIEFQAPTADNNYTWYRKYADGWVEQGGYCYASGSAAVSISYPIELTRAEIPLTDPIYSYDAQIFLKGMQVQTISTTGFTCRGKAVTSSNSVWENSNFSWQVSGMAAN